MKVYCVMEGEAYPEGSPDGVFETLEDAKNYVLYKVDRPEDKSIYEYTLNRDGYEKVFDCLGRKI